MKMAILFALIAITLTLPSDVSCVSQPTDTLREISRVAPIFVHGEGCGTYGCLLIHYPVFLSEDEAFKVIRDEAKRAGIRLKPQGLVLQKVEVPYSKRFDGFLKPEYYIESPAGTTATTTDSVRYAYRTQTSELRDLSFDGFDSTKKIGVEFVSFDDYQAWKQPAPPGGTEWSRDKISVDMQKTASNLRNVLAGATFNGLTLGIFYDPIGLDIWGGRDGKRWARNAAKEELRKQVRDFITWLKSAK
jgi:hypothetical protein